MFFLYKVVGGFNTVLMFFFSVVSFDFSHAIYLSKQYRLRNTVVDVTNQNEVVVCVVLVLCFTSSLFVFTRL
jgi:hypothetical protein